MRNRFEKFKSGIFKDPLGTLWKGARVLVQVYVKDVFELALYFVYRLLLYIPLPVRTLAKLKVAINPVVRMDYKPVRIYIHADSELGIYRARACTKEPETVEWMERNFQSGDVFYDIGANIGAYSLVAAKLPGKKVSVHAFEPSFSTYYQLCRNVVLNDCQDSIFPYLVALTEQTGLLTFSYRSLEAGSAEHFSSPDPSATPSGMRPVYKQKIFGLGLDTLIGEYHFPPPRHIKLDVDGAEFSVLKGARNTLRTGSVKSILVEVRTTDGQEKNVVEYLTSLGFELASRFDRGDGVIWNVIFMRVKK